MIAQGKSGRMIVDGFVSPPQLSAQGGPSVGAEATPSWGVNARFSLQSTEGRRDFGAFNFSLILAAR